MRDYTHSVDWDSIDANLEYPNEKIRFFNSEAKVDGFTPSTKGMISVVKKKCLLPESFWGTLCRLRNDDEIEALILNLIESYNSASDDAKEHRKYIFHLIEIWGGRAGRMKYSRGKAADWDAIDLLYAPFVEVCIAEPEPDMVRQICKIFEAVKACQTGISHMGVAFMTKHSRFWLSKSMGANALPIFDSIMAKGLGYKAAELRSLKSYWAEMYDHSLKKARTLDVIERVLFIRFFTER